MNALYQLHCRPGLRPGQPVFIDGPHDRFGRIVEAQGKKAPLGQPYELYLIRGTGFQEPVELMEAGVDGVADTVTFNPAEPGSGTAAAMKEISSLRDVPIRRLYTRNREMYW
jgi:hypothetical protein